MPALRRAAPPRLTGHARRCRNDRLLTICDSSAPVASAVTAPGLAGRLPVIASRKPWNRVTPTRAVAHFSRRAGLLGSTSTRPPPRHFDFDHPFDFFLASGGAKRSWRRERILGGGNRVRNKRPHSGVREFSGDFKYALCEVEAGGVALCGNVVLETAVDAWSDLVVGQAVGRYTVFIDREYREMRPARPEGYAASLAAANSFGAVPDLALGGLSP